MCGDRQDRLYVQLYVPELATDHLIECRLWLSGEATLQVHAS